MLQEQVLSIEQVKHLQELRLNINNTSIYQLRIIRTDTNEIEHDWYLGLTKEVPISIMTLIERKLEVIPTLTVQDILDLLPSSISLSDKYSILDLTIEKSSNIWIASYKDMIYNVSFESESLINSLYNMLCWCIEHSYLKNQYLTLFNNKFKFIKYYIINYQIK